MSYVLRLSTNPVCYATEGMGHRTVDLDKAQQFKTRAWAMARLAMERPIRVWPRAEVLEAVGPSTTRGHVGHERGAAC